MELGDRAIPSSPSDASMLKEHLRKSRLLDSILAARDAKVPLADAWVRRKAPGRAGVDMTASAPNLKQLTRASSSVDRGVTIGTAAGSEQGATENRAPSGSGSVFPQWLLSRSDFKDISDVPIQTAVMRRENAEAYIREEESLEPRAHAKFFQGPQRSLNIRRNAFTVRSHVVGLDDDAQPHTDSRMNSVRSLTGKAAAPPSKTVVAGVGGTLKRMKSQHVSPKKMLSHRGSDGSMLRAKSPPPAESEAEERDRILAPLEAEKAKHVRAHRSDMLNLDDAERQLQRAFVIRASTFGMEHGGTRKSKETLLKCYFTLGKTEDVKSLRDAPHVHLEHLQKSLAQYDEEERKANLSKKLRYMTKATAMVSMLRKGVDEDRLSVKTRRRSSVKNSGRQVEVPNAFPHPGEKGALNSVWPLPPETADPILFQGVRGGEDRLHDLNLVKGGHVYGGGTVTEPRALPLMPAPSSVSGVRPAVKALGAAGLHVEMAETLGELKERTKEAMERTNFSLAASLSRLALAKGEDPALFAMFRASLGQLSDFPRSVDFLATVRIETRGRAHIIGEPLIVKYSYIHDDDVIDTEHSLDSLGFRGPRCQPHSSCDWIGLTVVLPGQDGTLPPSSAAGKHSADGRACLNGNIDFGDCVGEPHCRHTEKLLAWCIVPEPNTGSITFSGSPSIPGPYRVRYFLHGSQVSIGNVVDVVAEFVKCELSIPPEIMLGDVLPVSYKLNYQQDSDRTGSDWVGLFVVPDSAAPEASSTSNLPPAYDSTKPIDCLPIPAGTRHGVIYFKRHPVYCGRYEARLFANAAQSSLSATSHPVLVKTRTLSFDRYAPYKREVRIFFANCFPGTKPERLALMKYGIQKLRLFCDKYHVSVSLVDLLFQGCSAPFMPPAGTPSAAQFNATRELDLEEMARLSLLEIEECRPFVIAMMSQAYGWIPTHLPLWLGVMFPWLKSFQNPHIPNDRGQELEFTDKRRTSELTKPDAIALGDKPIPSKLKSLLQSAVLKGPPSYVKMSRNQRLSINLFGRINGLDTNFTAMHPSQDLGLSLTRISVFELQMMAAFAIPRMRPHHVAGNILALTRQARRAKQGGPVAKRGPKSVLSSLVNRHVSSVNMDPHPTRHCVIYSRHPALLLDAGNQAPAEAGGAALSGEFSMTQFVPRERVLDLASGALRATSRGRHDPHRSGYDSISRFVDWVVDDMSHAIATEFPESEVPHPQDLPSLASQAFAFSRLSTFVESEVSFLIAQHLDAFVTRIDRVPTRPTCVIGPRGSGKSANIAFWALQFYDSHCAGKSYDPVDITKPRVMEVPPPDDALLSGAATPVPGMSTPIVPPSGMGTPLIPPHVGTASPIRKGLAAFMSAATASASPFSPPAKPKAPAPTMRQCTHSAPMRMIYFQNDVRFHMIVVHLGEAGVGKSTAKVLSLIADELELAIGGGPLCPCTPPATALRKALASRQVMEDTAAATAYMENIRRLFIALVTAALKYFRLVLVLDGVDHIKYSPLTASNGPRKLEAYDVHGKSERRNSLKGDKSSDPFFNTPPPLWWLPAELPVGLHIVLSLSCEGSVWPVVTERNWNRESITVNPLSQASATLLMEKALGRLGVDQSWGHNHGVMFRTVLDDVFVHDSLDTVDRLLKAPPHLPPAHGRSTSASDAPTEPLEPLLPKDGEQFRAFVSRMLVDGDPLSHEFRAKYDGLRNPMFMRMSIALLTLSSDLDEMLTWLFQIRSSALPDVDELAEELLSTLFQRYPIAYDALCLLALSENGLQEIELLELLGCLVPPSMSMVSHSATSPMRAKSGVGEANLSSESTANRAAHLLSTINPKMGINLADVLPRAIQHFPTSYENLNLPSAPSEDFFKASERFSMAEWSDCRRALLSFAVTSCRGLLCIDSSVILAAVESLCLPTSGYRYDYLQRLAGYFWALPMGQRRVEELPPAIHKLWYFAHLNGVAMMAGPDGAKHRIGSEAASARQTVFNNHFPETLFAFGVPASCAFPPEPRVIATRALMAFTNIEVLSMADELGGFIRISVLQGLFATGRQVPTILAAIRQSFESYNGITGFAKSPSYHLVKGAVIDPFFVKPNPDEPPPRRRQPTREDELVTLEGADWEAFRETSHAQLYHIAKFMLDMGHFSGAQSSLESSILLNTNCTSFEELLALSEKMLLALDTVGVFRVAPVPTRDPRSHGWAPFPIVAAYSSFDIRAVAASSAKRETAKPTVSDALVETGDLSITVDVTRGGALRAGNALDVVPLVVGHMSWTLPLLNAGERRKSSGKGEEPVVPVTIVDVEALAISIADLALLYKRRLEAHLLHIVTHAVSEEEFKRPRTHVLHDVDIFAATDKVESLWKFTRQFHRVVGPRNPTIDKAETTFQAISKLQIPNRREYFKHR